MNRIIIKVVVFISVAITIVACYPTRNMADGEQLLLKNKFDIEEGSFRNNEISAYYVQRPNQKLFFHRFYLRSYNLGTAFKDSSLLHKFFTENLGELPVILDSVKLDKTKENITKYLFNNGYFNAKVDYSVIPKGRKKKAAIVNYKIELGSPYLINDISINSEQRDIKTFVQADFNNSKLKTGDRFIVDNIKEERERITDKLRNNGYYTFNKSYITFDIDTNLNSNKLNISVNLNTIFRKNNDSSDITKLKRYKINNIYIYDNIDDLSISTKKTDTLLFKKYEKDIGDTLVYHIIYYDKIIIKPKAIVRSLYIKPKLYYKQYDVRKSYSLLSQMNNYKLIEIQMADLEVDEKIGKLDCYVKLSRKDRITYGANTEVQNTGGDLGFEQSFNISHSNAFRKAEVLKLSVYGAMEMRSSGNLVQPDKFFERFNTYETGANLNLYIPRFLMPANEVLFPKYFNPNTNIRLGYNFQNRPDFKRNILNLGFGYSWAPLKSQNHRLKLIDISAVKINPTPEFQNEIDNLRDPRLKYSYQNHLVINSSYKYIYSGDDVNSEKPFFYFSIGIENGGLLLDLIHNALNGEKDNNNQGIVFGVPYAQYLKFENDIRYYFKTGKKVMNVLRAYTGIGLPYNNSKALPFEKSFYIGGANSLRAYPLGMIGLGSYYNANQLFEKTGDIKLEANYELRFPIAGSLNAAVFGDAGNIWLLKKSDDFIGGEFSFERFLSEFYLNFGYGLRYDLQYLIIRFDIGHPIYQPYYQKGDRWTMRNTNNKILTGFNFAIGYPF